MGTFAASVPPGRVFMSPLPEYLRIIRENEWRWRASSWGFAVATVLMAIGLLLTTSVGPGRLYAGAAFVAFVVVAPCWLGTLALRLELTVSAANGRVDPAWYDAIGKWSTSLYGFFMVGGYAAVALLGASLIGESRIPQWTAWLVAVFGALAMVWFWIGRPRVFGMRGAFDLPVLVNLVPLFVAIPMVADGLAPIF